MTRPVASPRRSPGSLSAAKRGFTLVELVIVLAMLVVVLSVSYQILNNCVECEKMVERWSQPEKVGDGILAMMRRDLAGVFFRGMTEPLMNQVFVGLSGEGPDGPQDEVRFLTTVEPTPLGIDTSRRWDERPEELRTITVVGYFLQPNPKIAGYNALRLYRKEITDFLAGTPMEAPGLNFEIYDKVKSLDFEYYDGYEWLTAWSSEEQILAQEQLLLEEARLQEAQQNQIARVSQQAAAEEEALTETELVLPPAAIPCAVRIVLEIYAGVGDEIFVENNQPVIRTFRTIVPLFVAQRIGIPPADQLAGLTEDLSGVSGTGDGGTGSTSGASGGTSGFMLPGMAGGRGGGARPERGARGGGQTAGGGFTGRGGRTGGGRGALPGAGGRTPAGAGGLPGRGTAPAGGTGGSIRSLPGLPGGSGGGGRR
ncbi:MAG: prepilin-type N-terminal cleavage/methylation domain-containing protein [Planctomycetes bacterium]|nr:prepilin-type N-terminal cleavage/methylation domain-containing protein [Planctomycetota bacterium]